MYETTRIYKDDEGLWRWIYRLPMFKNFSILRTLLKAVGLCCLGILIYVLIIIYSNGSTISDSLDVLGIIFAVFAAVFVITFLCYLGVAALFGGSYIFIYTLSNTFLTTNQTADQAAKSKAIGLFTAAAGALDMNPGLTIAGLAAGSSQIVHTQLDKVLTLKFDRKNGEVRIHSFLTWYSIYVHPDDFTFIEEFLKTRCTKARIFDI